MGHCGLDSHPSPWPCVPLLILELLRKRKLQSERKLLKRVKEHTARHPLRRSCLVACHLACLCLIVCPVFSCPGPSIPVCPCDFVSRGDCPVCQARPLPLTLQRRLLAVPYVAAAGLLKAVTVCLTGGLLCGLVFSYKSHSVFILLTPYVLLSV